MSRRICLALLLSAVVASTGLSQPQGGEPVQREVLPKPTYENTFFVTFRCYDFGRAWKQHGEDRASVVQFQEEFLQDFYRRLGPQRLYCRFGLRGGELPELVEKYHYATPGGVTGWHRIYYRVLGDTLSKAAEEDRRLLQWFSDGRTETQRKTHFGPSYVTVSRYAAALWEPILKDAALRAPKAAERIASAGDNNAGTQLFLNGPGEPSLLETGWPDRLICDYSPFAVAEFRDWLTHRGEYAVGGKFEGQGRKGGEVFASDPSPDKATGAPHKTFNETCGTDFTTWDLLYWDLDKFPESLSYDANPRPDTGETGHTAGGFHPPVDQDDSDPFWLAWNSEDPFNPGFRQMLIKHYIDDMKKPYFDAGVPIDRMYNSVILLGTDGKSAGRRFADADPPWVSAGPYSSVGYTIYGKPSYSEETYQRIQEVLDMVDSQNWAFVEYHPYPLPPALYTTSVDDYSNALEVMYKHRPHYVEVEGWTGLTFGGHWGYVTKDTNFEMAWRKFFASLPDQPYYLKEKQDYAPPPVREVAVQREENAVLISWSGLIWEDRPFVWSEWREFSHFGVYGDGRLLLETAANTVSIAPPNNRAEKYEVRAIRRVE